MNYQQLKQNYLSTLQNTKEKLDEILNTSTDILNNEEIKDLEKLQKINKKFITKLNKEEIEVAIIGAENGGKSTFANAFVKLKEAFPTGSIRTTYTSTKLKYGNDRAIVTFYKTEEFDEIFNELLEQIKYPNRNGLKNFDINDYKSYFENLKQTDKKLYDDTFATINKDIVEIAEGKEIIFQYLNQPPKYFDKTQIENQELKKFITDKYIARSVKNIDIELSSFKDTKEMVLYDVPGFDSLTEKHKIETKKSLDMADAIILIKNIVENPNIRSHEADILKSYDENGLPLYEKLFAFGTQIDKANNIDDAKINAFTFKKELKEHLNMKENRIFYGSPFAYLEQIELYKSNRSIEKMKNLQLEQYINSIDKIREAIKAFYKNEAFNNLQKQIDKNISNIKTILNSILEKNKDVLSYKHLEVYSQLELFDFVTQKQNEYKNKLDEQKYETKKDILKNQYFSNTIKKQIEKISIKIDEKDIDEIHKKESGLKNEFPTNKVNTTIRKEILSPKFRKILEVELSNIMTDKYQEVYTDFVEKIIENLFEVLEIDTTHQYKNELKTEFYNLISKYLKDITTTYNKNTFNYFINKFTHPLIEIIIESEKGLNTRKERFEKFKKDILSLAYYYEEDYYQTIFNKRLVEKILNLAPREERLDEIKKIYQNDYEEFVEFEYLNHFSNQNSVSFDFIKNIIKENYKVLTRYDNRYTRREGVKNVINQIKELNITEEQKLNALFSKVIQSSNKDELIEELNNDIELFIDIIQKAVIPALNIETSFIITLIEIVDNILKDEKLLRDFLVVNYEKIKYKELSKEKEKIEKLKNDQNILFNVQNILRGL